MSIPVAIVKQLLINCASHFAGGFVPDSHKEAYADRRIAWYLSEISAEAELAEDRRIYGNAFYRMEDGRKVRIPPTDVWVSSDGQYLYGPLSDGNPCEPYSP